MTVYCPEELPLLGGLGNAHAHCPRVRAATKSVLVHAVMNHLTGLLEEDSTLGINRHSYNISTIVDSGFTVVMFLYVHNRPFQEH